MQRFVKEYCYLKILGCSQCGGRLRWAGQIPTMPDWVAASTLHNWNHANDPTSSHLFSTDLYRDTWPTKFPCMPVYWLRTLSLLRVFSEWGQAAFPYLCVFPEALKATDTSIATTLLAHWCRYTAPGVFLVPGCICNHTTPQFTLILTPQ